MVDAHHHRLFKPHSLASTNRPPVLDVSICNSTSFANWEPLFAEIDSVNRQYIALGIHPWFIDQQMPDNWLDVLASYITHPGVSIGEIGLDKKSKRATLEEQLTIFRPQWILAIDYNICPSIHCVGAWNELYQVIRETGTPERGFYLHGFAGSKQLAKQFLAAGAIFGIQYKNWQKWETEDLFTVIPHRHILPETDFSPKESSDQKHDNDLSLLHQKLAKQWNLAPEDLITTLSEQVDQLFL